MAKPILVIKVPSSVDKDDAWRGVNNLPIKDEYHVIIVVNDTDSYSFECFNDCKGLMDADIEDMIKTLKSE